jgi:hypothetical protein
MALQDGTYDPLAQWWNSLGGDPLAIASTEGVPFMPPPVTPPAPAPQPEIALPPVAPPPVDLAPPAPAPPVDVAPPMPEPEPVRTGLQPGLGIPTSVVDPAVAGQMLADQEQAPLGESLPPMPAPDGEIEFEPDQLDESDRRASFAALSDVEFAQEGARQAEERRQIAAGAAAKAAHDEARQAEADLKIFQESRAQARQQRQQVEAEAARMADSPEDDWKAAGGIDRSIFGAIAVVLGGLTQHLNNGRNIGLDMIDKSVDRFIQQRKENLVGKRQAAADMAADADGDFRQSTAIRVAAYERAVRQIDAEIQNYDPKGTMAYKLESTKREALGRQAAAIAAFEEREIKRLEAQGKSQLEIAKHLETVRKNQIDAENDRRKTSIDAMRAATDRMKTKSDIEKTKAEIKNLGPGVTYSPEQLAQLYPGNPVPPIPMNEKQYGTWLEVAKKGQDVAKVSRENSPEERAGQLGAGDLVQADGKTPVLFRDSAAAAKVSTSRAAVDNVARLVDQIVVARKKYGWGSDLFRSDEWRAAQADMGSLIIEGKNVAELGALSGPDMDLIEKTLGTKDPTELRDPLAGLEQARSNAVEKFNSTLRAEARPGQKPKRYEPPKIAAAEAEERDIAKNLDVYDAPEIDDPSVDIEIRKRAAARAVEGADATSRKVVSDPGGLDLLKILAAKNAERAEAGLIEPGSSAKAQKAFRKRYRNILKDLAIGGKSGEVDAVGAPVYNPRAIDDLSDEEIDKRMGVGGKK